MKYNSNLQIVRQNKLLSSSAWKNEKQLGTQFMCPLYCYSFTVAVYSVGVVLNDHIPGEVSTRDKRNNFQNLVAQYVTVSNV